MRVAIYVRVSTQRQTQTQSIDQQLDRLREVVANRGWTLSDEHVFRDDGYSGSSLRRPGLDRLRDQASLARFDLILITDPDRLARNYVHQVLLLEELQRHGCRVEFADRPLSDDPHDQLLLQIRGAVAEYERTLIAERTRRGRLHKLQSGQLLPWTRTPYGYRVDPDRPRDPAGVQVDPAEAAIVAEMFAWYLHEGRSLLGLVKHLQQLGAPSPTGKPFWGLASVRGVLTNPTYTGQVYVNRTRCQPARIRRSSTHPIGRPQASPVPTPPQEWIPVATVPAIVTREQFDRVRSKLSANRSFAARNNKSTNYLLRALVSCGACGLACQARRALPSGRTYYVCTGKNLQVRQRTGAYCHSRLIPAGALDELVWKDLLELLRSPGQVATALRRAAGGCWLPQELQARQENLRRGRASLAQQLERLTEAYLSGVVPLAEYQRRRADLERRDTALAAQQEQLSGEASRVHEVAGLAVSAETFARRVSAGLEEATFEQRRHLVELLIDRVIVTGDAVEIRYVIPTGPAGEHGRFCHLRIDYVGHPHLVGMPDAQLLQPVGPMPEAGPVDRRPHQPPHLHQQAGLTHDAQHQLAVDPPATPPQLHGHAPVAVTRELQRDLLDGGPQFGAVTLASGVVVRAGGQLDGPAQQAHVELVGEALDQPAFVGRAQSSIPDNFFEADSSTVRRPMTRSSSAMRCWSRSAGVWPAKTWAACSRSCWRQRQTTVSER
jgi:site-specific DNA recombinase